jgi:hypothetical protein
MPVFYQTGDIKFHGAAAATLHQLVSQMRQRSGGYLLTSVAHGTRDHRLAQTLNALRALGVEEAPAPRPLGLEGSGLGFIVIEARSGRSGASVAMPVLLAIAQPQAQGLLLPAVQQVRDAARRMAVPAGTRIFVGGGAAAASASPHDGRAVWHPLARAGGDHAVENQLAAAR